MPNTQQRKPVYQCHSCGRFADHHKQTCEGFCTVPDYQLEGTAEFYLSDDGRYRFKLATFKAVGDA